jgi:predicted nuclease of predicted toxin-antitoxin system
MRFLIDTNLPPALAFWLAAEGFEAMHTKDLGLEHAKDRAIWRYAKDNNFCIVTKDEDFVLYQVADTSGPKVVWVRIGNAIRRILLQRMAVAWPAVLIQLQQGALVVEVR